MTRGYQPFGDNFIVQTPDLDRLDQRLYQQQQQRELWHHQQLQGMDKNVEDEMTNIRPNDIPEFLQKVNDWKQSQKNVDFNPAIRKDANLYSQARMDALSKLASLHQYANESSNTKDLQNQIKNMALKNPSAVSNDFYDRLSTLQKTPLSQIKNHPVLGNLTDIQKYQYLPKADWGKIHQTAAGKPAETNYSITNTDPGGLSGTKQYSMFGATPNAYYNNVINQLANPQMGREIDYRYNQLTPEQIKASEQAYNQIPIERFKQMGLSAPDTLPDVDPNNHTQVLARYMAQQHALNSPITFAKPQNWNNAASKLALQHQYRSKEISQRLAGSEQLIKDRHALGIGDNDANSYNDPLDPILQNLEKNAKPLPYKTSEGTVNSLVLPANEAITKALTQQSGIHSYQPDEVRKVGDKYVAIHYQRDPTTNEIQVYKKPNGEEGTLVDNTKFPPKAYTADELKDAMAKYYLTGKARNERVINRSNVTIPTKSKSPNKHGI